MAKRVMIIDDDVEIGKMYAVALDAAGYETEYVSVSAEGLKKLEKDPVDVVVVDVMMPVIDGLEVVRRLRAMGKYEMKILLMSSMAEESLKGKVDHLKVAGVLDKSVILPGDLVSEVRHCLGE